MDLLHAANLRHGTEDFTSPPEEGVLRIFFALKIGRLRPGLNPRTWVPKASTLPLDHQSCFMLDKVLKLITMYFFLSLPFLSVAQQPNTVSGVLFLRFLDHTQSAGLSWSSDQPVVQTSTYTTHNKHNRRTSIPSAGLELTIPPTARLQNYVLNARPPRSASIYVYNKIFLKFEMLNTDERKIHI